MICTLLEYEEDFVNPKDYINSLIETLKETYPEEYRKFVDGKHEMCTRYPTAYKKVRDGLT